MREQWLSHCVETAATPADFWSGARKIVTGLTVEFKNPLFGQLDIEDSGFTRTKLGMLRRLYWSDDHAAAVAELWRERVKKGRYGSVGVSTYHHLTKADPAKRSKRASVMGPCLLGVTLTLLNDRTVALDAMYRTTELLKKFPADLVFIREVVAPAFDLYPKQVSRLRCHFANCTVHPMYWVTILPLLADPIQAWERMRAVDQRLFDWSIKWTGRYICPEHHRGIAKFAQALRVQKDAYNRLKDQKLALLREFVRDNHPGYRNSYAEEDDEEEEE